VPVIGIYLIYVTASVMTSCTWNYLDPGTSNVTLSRTFLKYELGIECISVEWVLKNYVCGCKRGNYEKTGEN
jgi:hypothetical protein